MYALMTPVLMEPKSDEYDFPLSSIPVAKYRTSHNFSVKDFTWLRYVVRNVGQNYSGSTWHTYYFVAHC